MFIIFNVIFLYNIPLPPYIIPEKVTHLLTINGLKLLTWLDHVFTNVSPYHLYTISCSSLYSFSWSMSLSSSQLPPVLPSSPSLTASPKLQVLLWDSPSPPSTSYALPHAPDSSPPSFSHTDHPRLFHILLLLHLLLHLMLLLLLLLLLQFLLLLQLHFILLLLLKPLLVLLLLPLLKLFLLLLLLML